MEKKKSPVRPLFNQSSELEILISAAIVFAAFSIGDLVPEFISRSINHNIPSNSPVLVLATLLALFLSTLLPISIFLHFILRFYWLSLLGLNSVYSKPKFEKLNFALKHEIRIKRKYSPERHIDFIDKLCSSIFAFSFLTVFVFCFTSISIFIILGGFIYLIDGVFAENMLMNSIVNILLLIFLFACLLSFIDFFSLGSLKKIRRKWFIRIYYPINRFMGFITLSYFYRGLYYTFISNIPRSVAAFVLPAYLILAIILLNAGFYESSLYAGDRTSIDLGPAAATSYYYQENFSPLKSVIFPFIPALHIEKNYLPVYIPLKENIEDVLIEECDSVSAINDRGFHWRKVLNLPFNKRYLPQDFNYRDNAENALECFNSMIELSIGNKKFGNNTFRFFQLQEPDKITIMTTLDIEDLPKGEHVLEISFKKPMAETSYSISFYKALD